MLPLSPSRWCHTPTCWLSTVQQEFLSTWTTLLSRSQTTDINHELFILHRCAHSCGRFWCDTIKEDFLKDAPTIKKQLHRGTQWICVHVTDQLCDNIALVSTPSLQNTIACYCSYLDAACIWRPALQQLCLDLGLSEAGRGAPRQVSVGTQSIIDRSPRLRLLCWSQVSESWGGICLKFTAYDKMGRAEMSFCSYLWTRKINVENRCSEKDFYTSITDIGERDKINRETVGGKQH